MSRSVIVLPDDSAKPTLDAIANAKKSLRIKMFIFSDPSLLHAVVTAQHRGIDVRIMLNPERRDGEKENHDARKTLTDAGVHVIDSNPNFDLTHEKSMVIDDETAFVQSLNWETKNLTVTRDYTVVTSHKHEVEEVAQCFDADWNRTKFDAGDHSHLISSSTSSCMRSCSWLMTSSQSSAPSTSPPAASIAGVNLPSKSGMNPSSVAFTRRSRRTGQTRIPSISPMRVCLPSSRKTIRMPRRSCH
jgi:hypothetical protein